MAVAHIAPTCQFCGAPTAMAIYNQAPKDFFGDTFQMWVDIPHSCKQKRKWLREWRKQPEVIAAKKEMKKRLKIFKQKQNESN